MKKTGIRKEDVKYVVNQEEKKVVAFVEETKMLAVNFIEENFPHLEIWYDDPMYLNLLMPDRFVGIATCSELDVWDENIGRLIAFNRLKKKLDTCMFKRLGAFVDEMDRRTNLFCERTNQYGEKLEKNMMRRDNTIAGLVGEDE